MTRSDAQELGYEARESAGGEWTFALTGRIDAGNAGRLLSEINHLLREKKPLRVTLDLSGVQYMDDFGVLLLLELKRHGPTGEGAFRILNPGPKIQEILDMMDFEALADEHAALKKKRPPNALVRLGEASIRQFSEGRFALSFLGDACLALGYVILHPRSLRGEDTIQAMQRTGVDAVPIVGLISLLLGLIMAFMSAVQLEQFGANIYVASLVSLAMVRELGPIMTAILVAGRSGSSYAAEIGTMKISEEVDALYSMGFNTTRFLVVPKILASVLVVPVLTLFSDLFAIFGGLVVGVSMLNLTAGAYIDQTIQTLSLFDVSWGFFKSAVFGLLIAYVGCLRGFQVRGGAAAVGQATTSAVVSGIFLIILFDSIFAVILTYWG